MLSEELSILDADSSQWQPLKPLLDIALRLEQHAETYVWHGWYKQQIELFLRGLPAHCTLLVGVWETSIDQNDKLVLGCICEVSAGEICAIRTFETLSGLPDVRDLQPGFEHASLLMKATSAQVAPVAWALFTDKATWDEWLFAESLNGKTLDKDAVLTALALQGRCVLLGSQTQHHP